MNKKYTTPSTKVIEVNTCRIICASVRFGEGDTATMHAPMRGFGDGWDW